MTEPGHDGDKTLEQLIYQIARAYVFGRLGAKYDLEWQQVKGTSREKDYNEKKEKVAREAFLAARSRTGRDFVNYFTSTLCSVGQRLDEAGYLQIARALHDEGEVEHVRSLTLLALSASG